MRQSREADAIARMRPLSRRLCCLRSCSPARAREPRPTSQNPEQRPRRQAPLSGDERESKAAGTGAAFGSRSSPTGRRSWKAIALPIVPAPRGDVSDRADRGPLRLDLAGADRASHGDGLRADQHRADLAAAGLGSPQVPGNQILTALALLLTALVMRPHAERVYHDAVRPYAAGELSAEQAWAAGSKPIKAFMVDQIVVTKHQDYLESLYEYAVPESPGRVDPGQMRGRGFSAARGGAGVSLERADDRSADGLLHLPAVPGDRPGGLVGAGGHRAVHASAVAGGDAGQADRLRAGRRLAADRDHVAVELRSQSSCHVWFVCWQGRGKEARPWK